MSMKSAKRQKNRLRDYDRQMLRTKFLSLIWAVISDRRQKGDFTLQALADEIGRDKSAISRWFSGDPNWTIDTIADLVGALDLELRIEATERTTGAVYTPAGIITKSNTETFVPISSVTTPSQMPKYSMFVDAA